MKITAVETLRLREFANLIWVRIQTDQGLIGLGETFMGASAVEAYLHDTVAPKLLGKDPLQIEARNRDLANYLGWGSAGVETRGNSAVDLALWDLFGKAHGRPCAKCWAADRATRFASTTPARATSTFAMRGRSRWPTGMSTKSAALTKTSKASCIAPMKSHCRCSTRASPP